MKTNRETIIIRNGKPIYAIKLKEDDNRQYLYISEGEVRFSDCYFNSTEFDFNDKSHTLAKQIFKEELKTNIKRKILELKQLEEILNSLNVNDILDEPITQQSKGLLDFFKTKKENK